MTRLGHSEIAAFSRGLTILESVGGMDTLADRITRCLHALFDCELVSYDLIDPSAVQWNSVVISPVIPEWPDAIKILQHHAHEHPIVNHAVRNSDPRAIRTSDLLSLRQYRQLGLYHDFFRARLMRMDRQLGFVTRTSDALTLGVSVNRRGGDFSAGQRALLEFLRPHLLQAYTSARAHARLLGQLAAADEYIGVVVGGGLCEVDVRGQMSWATGSVNVLLRKYFPREHRGEENLPEPLVNIIASQARAIQNQREQNLQTRRTWRVRGAQGVLTIHLTARSVNGTWHLLLVDESNMPSVLELTADHALTKREAEVLFWIGQGKTNDEIGSILGMATRTAGKHVERILTKLEVPNRTAAARVALGK